MALATPDITIRGAGIFGLSIAWTCLARGARVCVIDPGGVGSGASGGVVGALAPHVPEAWNAKKAFQFESLLAAEHWWRDVDAASGLASGYARTGRLQPLADTRAVDLARAREDSARELWGGAARWRVVEKAPGAWVPASPTGWYVHDDLTARVHPARACRSLAAAVEAKGGQIVTEGDEVGPVVHATGWRGLADLSDSLARSAGVGVKGQAILLAADVAQDVPQVFADGLHIVPHDDGTVAVGSTTERDWTDEAPDAAADALKLRAVEVLPSLAPAPIVQRWAGIRPRAASRAPLLGRWPGREGHFVANGGFKIGFGVAVGIAERVADLVLDGRDTIPAAFRIDVNP